MKRTSWRIQGWQSQLGELRHSSRLTSSPKKTNTFVQPLFTKFIKKFQLTHHNTGYTHWKLHALKVTTKNLKVLQLRNLEIQKLSLTTNNQYRFKSITTKHIYIYLLCSYSSSVLSNRLKMEGIWALSSLQGLNMLPKCWEWPKPFRALSANPKRMRLTESLHLAEKFSAVCYWHLNSLVVLWRTYFLRSASCLYTISRLLWKVVPRHLEVPNKSLI